MRKGKGEILVCMDGDLSHNPKYLQDLISKFKDDRVDFALGSRFINGGNIETGWGLYRYLNSGVATFLAKPLARNITDPMSGFFAIPQKKFQEASYLKPLGYKIGLELMVKCDCRNVKEIPIYFEDRKHGESKLNFKEQLNYLVHLTHLYDFKFPRVATSLKFLITFILGIISAFLTASAFKLNIDQWHLWYAPILITHGVLYCIYLSLSKDIIKISHPVLSFMAICLMELLVIYGVVNLINMPEEFLLLSLIAGGGLGRFLGRKMFKHDLKPGMLFKNEMLTFEKSEFECISCRSRKFFLPYGIHNKWLLECSSCSFQFAFPQPSDDELNRIYNSHYFEEWGDEKSSSALGEMKKLTFKKILGRVQHHIEIKSCLDFGCGLGYVIDQGLANNLKMAGLEPIEEVRKSLNTKFKGKATIASDLPSIDETFDLITIYDVIEHLRDPILTLKELKKLLTANGAISITTIDKDSIWSRLMKQKWFHIHRAHLWYFDKRSLTKICEEAGYDMVYIRSSKKYFTLKYIFGILEAKSGYVSIRYSSKVFLKLIPDKILDIVLPPINEGLECLIKQK